MTANGEWNAARAAYLDENPRHYRPVTGAVVITVDELISVRVTPPAAPVSVASPDSNRVLAFVVTNVGNGQESFTLAPGYAISGAAFRHQVREEF